MDSVLAHSSLGPEAHLKNLAVSLSCELGGPFAGTLLGLHSRARLAILFPESTAPRLKMGGKVSLALSGPTLTAPIRIEAMTAREQRLDEETFYEFGVSRRTLHVLSEKLSCRRGLRVPPSSAAHTLLTVQGGASMEPLQGTVADLSEGGMGFLVRMEDEDFLVDSTQFSLTMHLGEEFGALELAARIVHREIESGFVRYGVAFEDVPEEVHEKLRRYLLLRHRALLRGED